MASADRQSLVFAAAVAAALAVPVAGAFAHEGRSHGDLEMVVGFGTEPAFAGQPNSVQVLLEHDGEPVVDLGDALAVEITFGDQTLELELEPFFAVGAFGTPGDYRAWFIPTRPGQYSFHLTGTFEDEEVDETFTSGPNTFGDVQNPSDVQFPVQDPTNGELAERIEREIPRLTAGIDEALTAAEQALTAAEQALTAAGSDPNAPEPAATEDSVARTFGIFGSVVGALGVALGAGGLAMGRRRR